MADEQRPKDPRDPVTTRRDDDEERRQENDREPRGAEEGRDRPPSHPDRDRSGPWLGGG
jgi:hypothetical protein